MYRRGGHHEAQPRVGAALQGRWCWDTCQWADKDAVLAQGGDDGLGRLPRPQCQPRQYALKACQAQTAASEGAEWGAPHEHVATWQLLVARGQRKQSKCREGAKQAHRGKRKRHGRALPAAFALDPYWRTVPWTGSLPRCP